MAAALLLYSPHETTAFGKSSLAAVMSASNIYFWKDASYFQTQNQLNPLLMTWSLGIEEQFYLVIPLLMVVLSRLRQRVMLGVILGTCLFSFALACQTLPNHPSFAFYLLPARAWELGCGVLLAVLESRCLRPRFSQPTATWVGVVGFGMMLAPLFLLHADSLFPGAAAFPSVVGTALLIAAASGWLNLRVLSATPLVFVGRVSYSWYLWHWPILAFLRSLSSNELHPALAASAVAASFAVAVLSFYLIEQPFRRSTRAPLPLLLRYAALVVVFAMISVVFWRSHGLPWRYPQLAALEEDRTALQTNPCRGEIGQDRPNLSARCYSSIGSRPVVAEWGDSHAAALASELRSLAEGSGYDFDELTKSACRPTSDPTWGRSTLNSAEAECLRFNRNAVQQMKNDPRIQVVIVADAWTHLFSGPTNVEGLVAGYQNNQIFMSENMQEDRPLVFLEEAIKELQISGKRVVVFKDVPNFDVDPLLNVWTSHIPPRNALAKGFGQIEESPQGIIGDTMRSQESRADALLKHLSKTLPDTQMVDLRPGFCDQIGKCIYRSGNTLLYVDNQHLSQQGAQFALRNFKLPELDR